MLVNTENKYHKWFSTKWYNHNSFSLIPVFQIIKADDHNTWKFNFRWLFLEMWSLDNLCFELAITCDTHWGVGLTAILPYLRIKFTIPIPEKLGFKTDNLFTRNPKCKHNA